MNNDDRRTVTISGLGCILTIIGVGAGLGIAVGLFYGLSHYISSLFS